MPDPPVVPPGSEEEKIIINGGRIYALTEVLCGRVEASPPDSIKPEARKKMIALLNKAENCIDAATEAYLRGRNYEGPVNHALQSDSNE